MGPQLLLVAALAGHTAPAPVGLHAPDLFALGVHKLPTLGEPEARALDSRRALYRVLIASEPDGDPEGG
jgi:hypothetical protein